MLAPTLATAMYVPIQPSDLPPIERLRAFWVGFRPTGFSRSFAFGLFGQFVQSSLDGFLGQGGIRIHYLLNCHVRRKRFQNKRNRYSRVANSRVSPQVLRIGYNPFAHVWSINPKEASLKSDIPPTRVRCQKSSGKIPPPAASRLRLRRPRRCSAGAVATRWRKSWM